MKVGILTYHRADNYGAVLQAYALQRIITMMGHKCEIIDYRCTGIESQFKYMKIKIYMDIIEIVKLNIERLSHIQKHHKFELFRQKLNMSTCSYSSENIEKTNELYDCFITGSDQVWNFSCNKNDYTYLLDFVYDKKKKNSYAASFGTSIIPSELENVYKTLLNTFNNISVREQQGARIIEQLLGKKCNVVLDPVFLLDNDNWSELTKRVGGQYILVYQLFKSETMIKAAQELALKNRLKIYIISRWSYGNIYGKTKVKNKLYVSPSEFISLFKSAGYILTNSFHGTAFSIIFHKEFYVEPVSGTSSTNSRFESLFEILNLHNRKIINGRISYPDSKIDYYKIDDIIQHERKASLGYLANIVTDHFYNEGAAMVNIPPQNCKRGLS